MNANDLTYPVFDKNDESHIGLTKREYFAAMAMQGFLSADRSPILRDGSPIEIAIAQRAVCYADAMIAELSK